MQLSKYYLDDKKLIVSVLFGMLSLILSRYYFVIDTVYNLKIVWSLIFPVIIAMVWEKKYVFVAYISGTCFIPFIIYRNHGWANIIEMLFYGVLLFANAMWNYSSKEERKTQRNFYALNMLLLISFYFAEIFFHSILLKFNGNWIFDDAYRFYSSNLLKLRTVNTIAALIMIITIVNVLLEMNCFRKLFNIKELPFERIRYHGILIVLCGFFCYVAFDSFIDSSYFGAKGIHVSLFLRNTGGYTRLTTIVTFVCFFCKYVITASCKREEVNNKIKEMNEKLERMVETRTKELSEAYNDLESFSYTISHELKTPLREISLYTQFISEDNDDVLKEESKEDLLAIKKVCDDNIEMVEKMMMYAKVGYAVLEKEQIDTESLIRDCLLELIKSHSDLDISVQIYPVPNLYADKFLIKQVFFNVLSNAIKFSEYNKTVKIWIGCMTSEDDFIFYIKDNGVGFQQKKADKLFELFNTVHNRSEYAGNGIGLATTKKIMDRHKGSIDMYAEKENGCIVFLKFPKKYN